MTDLGPGSAFHDVSDAMIARYLAALLALAALAPLGTAERPKLVGQSVRFTEFNVWSEPMRAVEMSLEFDQDLYLAQSTMCPNSDEGCRPVDCTPCDFTQVQSDPKRDPGNSTWCMRNDCCAFDFQEVRDAIAVQ